MPRNQEQNQEILDRRKEEILEAALEEFSRKGYSGTKISDVVKRAGISQGLVYHYYKSKDELYLAVIEKAVESSMFLVNMIKQYNLRGWNAISVMTNGVVEWLKVGGEGKLRFLFMQQAFMLDPMPEGVKQALIDSFKMTELTANLIKEAQEEGIVIDGDPVKISSLFWGSIQGIITNLVIMESLGLEEAYNIPETEMLLRIIKK